MPKMTVTCRELYYDKKSYRYGEQFEASEKDAKVLKLIGKATDEQKAPPLRAADPQPVKSKPAVQQQSSFVAEGEPVQPEGRGRRRYRRTDMQSED